jgi:hypothetical protein
VKKVLTILLILTAVALCGLSVAQWVRENRLREAIASLHDQLDAEHKLRVDTEVKVVALELENARISQLRADTEAKLLEVTEELNLTQRDQLQRGASIIVLANELIKSRQKVVVTEKLLAEANTAMENRSTDVTDQNGAITEANARLKQLTAERDKAIAEVNERTKAYNALGERYNKLTK